MKYTPQYFVSILLLLLATEFLNGQLIVDAGPDTILCELEGFNYKLGGDPVTEGGTPPYLYTWSCTYESPVRTYYASTFLSDTTISNPTIIELFDSITFFLNVTDSLQNAWKDSVTIINSIFGHCGDQCIDFIYEGDSTKLDHCVMGGIPPYSYSWSPQESLSNPLSSSPWAKPDISTLYELEITDLAGCITKSHCTIIVYPTSIATPTEIGDVIIYPNPVCSPDKFYVQWNNIDFACLKIFDLKGRVVKKLMKSENITVLETIEFIPGIYIYQIESEDSLIDEGKIIIN